MSERPAPDLDRVREALRDHDERTDDGEPPAPDGEPAAEPEADEDGGGAPAA